MFIATLIAADRLAPGDISLAADRLAAAGLEPGALSWVEHGEACDLPFSGDPAAARGALEGLLPRTDIVVQAETGRAKRLLISDMDSTMITVECIDELADYAGFKDRVSEITDRAMRGELDFEAALDARVALLKDMDASVVDRCHDERVRIMPGAEALVRTMKRDGATTILVSGGFTLFAERVAKTIGFDRTLSNVLGLGDGRLDGTVARPTVGAARKREVLIEAVAELGIGAEETLAVGDGANDIPMIEAAGLGVAYHAKPVTAAAAAARIDHGDLTALLFAQGYPRSRWAL